MPRGPELSKELRNLIYTLYVTNSMSEHAVMRFINNEDNGYLSKFGKVAIADVHYHVVKIREDLENSIDLDAMEKYTAEWVRIQNSLEQEADDIDKMVETLGKKEDMKLPEKELWLKLKRQKKETILNRVQVLQDHELPLTVKKFKKERKQQFALAKPIPLEEVQDGKQ